MGDLMLSRAKREMLPICALAVALACIVSVSTAHAQLLHLWEFSRGQELEDSVGGLDLIVAPGEGEVDGVFGTADDLTFETVFVEPSDQLYDVYRPYYVDVSMSANAGVGLTGSGFTSPNQFTIEAVVRADRKSSDTDINYIFMTRPGRDRGYFLIQDEDNAPSGAVSGLGTVIGGDFDDTGIPVGHADDGHWFYIAASIDLTSHAGQAVADIYAADLSAQEFVVSQVASSRAWSTEDPSDLAGVTDVFGIGGFPIDREGDSVAEASLYWFEGAIDYIAIYNGILSQGQLQSNLDARLTGREIPEAATLALAWLSGIGMLGIRRVR